MKRDSDWITLQLCWSNNNGRSGLPNERARKGSDFYAKGQGETLEA